MTARGRRFGHFLALVALLRTLSGSEASAVATEGDGETGWSGTTRRPDHLHLVEPNRSELRRYLQSIPMPARAKRCEEWTPSDSRAGMLLPVVGAARLFIGEGLDVGLEKHDVRIPNLERNYAVMSFAKAGAPFAGAITIMLSPELARRERACLERLGGVRIAWPSLTGDPTDVGETVEMVVTETRFSAAAEVGLGGALVATGDTVATLMISESWIAMVRRELRAHSWGIAGGIAGSVVLMCLTSAGGWGWRRWRSYRRLAGEQGNPQPTFGPEPTAPASSVDPGEPENTSPTA